MRRYPRDSMRIVAALAIDGAKRTGSTLSKHLMNLHGHSLYSENAHLSDFPAEQTIPVLESIFARAIAHASR